MKPKQLKPSTHITKAASLFVIVVGCLVLTGWFFDVPAFKSILPGIISMKFNTALCFILSGIALYLLDMPDGNKLKKKIVFTCAWIVLAAGCLNLSEYIFKSNLGIDELLWKEGAGTTGTTFPGRMSQSTALNFIFLGFIFLTISKRKFHWPIQALLIVMIPGSALVIFNHIFGVSFLNSFPQLVNTALHTALLFMLISIGIIYSKPLQYLNFSFQKKIAGFFVLTVLLLFFIFYAVNKNMENTSGTTQMIQHTNEILDKSERVHTEAAEMQGSVRGFVLTGNEDYLAPFTAAILTINSSVEKLKTLSKDNPRQQARIDSLQQFVIQSIAIRQSIIDTFRSTGFEAAKKIVVKGEGENITGRIRSLIQSIQQEEEQLLAKRKTENEKNFKNSSRVITLFQFIAVLLLLVAFMVIYYNTRRRNKLENEIKKTNIFLENILENIPSMIFVKEPVEHRFIQVNKQTEKTFGLSRKELLGKTDYDFFPKEKAEGYLNTEKEVFASGKPLEIPAELISTVNGDRWLRRNKIPVFDKNNQPLYLIGISEDITEKKKAEEQLKEYKYFFDNSNDLCLIANEQGYFETITPKVEEVLGYSNREITETPFIQLVHPDDISSTLLVYDELKAGATVINFVNRYRKKDGTYLWFDWNASPNPETHKLYCIARDITERKLLEEKLKQFNRELEKSVEEKTKEVIEKEQQYRFLLQNMREGIQVIGYDWRYLFLNNSVVHQSKYSNEELLGHTMMEKYPGIENTELFKTLQRCMKERIATVFENEFTFPNGTKEWFELSIQPIPEGLFILSMDITKRKRAEANLKKYMEELKISNSELERFAYVASHDLQEPLRMVSSFLNLLEEELEGKLNESSKEYISYAVDGAARMKTLVNDLLLYSRVGANKEDFTPTDLNEVMGYVTRVLQEDIEKNRAVITVRPLPVITANKTLISQLFTNLVSNALKYHGDKVPKIEVGYTEEPGNYIFYVKDNGLGIDPKFFDKIFIIFQRLHNKNEYSGTGIGLAICKKIVEIHNGKIWLNSRAGKGSTFYFSLPKGQQSF